MSRARLRHTLTLLPSGEVLVVGGLNRAQQAGESAEIFTPPNAHGDRGQWRSVAGPNRYRDGHRAEALRNGTVLVVGGLTGKGDPTLAEVFDPGTASWSPAGVIPAQIYGHTTTLLSDGKVLVAGGFTVGPGETKKTLLYDPATRQFSGRADMTAGRYGHTATLLPSGNVLVVGGWHGKSLDLMEEYDVRQDRWRRVGKLGQARDTHQATLLGGKHLLVVGGQRDSGLEASFFLRGKPVKQLELCDFTSGACVPGGQLGTPHIYAIAAVLPSAAILIFGGLDEPPTSGGPPHSYALLRAIPRSAK